MGRRLRSTFLVGVVVGIVLALLRARRDGRSSSPSLGGPSAALPRPAAAPGPAAAAAPAPAARAADRALPPTDAGPGPEIDGDGDGDGEAGPEPAPVPAMKPSAPPEEPQPRPAATPAADVVDGSAPEASSPAWVAPVDGGCPDGYPVKAKETSRIFHVPGGLSYARTRPDRCYPDAATAEADGFRPAKR